MNLLACLFCLSLELLPGHVKRTIDGDTFVLYHVGVRGEERVRVLCVETPEVGEPGYTEAGQFTAAWLAAAPFTIETCRRDSFGRYLAKVTRGQDALAGALVATGHGVAVPC